MFACLPSHLLVLSSRLVLLVGCTVLHCLFDAFAVDETIYVAIFHPHKPIVLLVLSYSEYVRRAHSVMMLDRDCLCSIMIVGNAATTTFFRFYSNLNMDLSPIGAQASLSWMYLQRVSRPDMGTGNGLRDHRR